MQHGASHSRSMLILFPLSPLSFSLSLLRFHHHTWHLLVAEARAYMHIPSLGKLLRACVRAVRQREGYFAGLRLTTVAEAAAAAAASSSSSSSAS
jgi:hypothetical protein